MPPRFDAVIFDLDGTLLDTLDAIAHAANAALADLGRPARPADDFRTLAGQGLPALIRAMLGSDDANLNARAYAVHRDTYAATSGRFTRRFAGIDTVLDTLTAQGTKLAVLSNKRDDATRHDVATFLKGWPFTAVRGLRDGAAPKPDPASGRALQDELGVPACRTAYVGDTAADMLTGKALGCTTIGVLWGFRDRAELERHGADAIAESPADLRAYFADQRKS